MTATKLFLNGDFKSSSDGKTIPQTNPATEQVFCEVSAASVADVQSAIEGAQQTFEHRAQTVDNAVLDLELVLFRAQPHTII